MFIIFFFKQKTAYEMRISDWSSDVCSSDLPADQQARVTAAMEAAGAQATPERPLAWIALEANRTVHHHELAVRYWPGGGAARKLAHAHAHGAWEIGRASGRERVWQYV